MVKKHVLIFYFIFTFIFSWLFWSIPIFNTLGIYNNPSLNSIYGLGVCSPVIISTFLSFVVFGIKGGKELFSRFSLKGIHIKWYIAAAFFPVLICFAAVFFYCTLYGKIEDVFSFYTISKYFSSIPLLLIFATLEEVGWRGFALPRLMHRYNPLVSSIILGIIWGVWHFPKFISEGITQVNSFIILMTFVILVSIFITWIYENSNGSISLSVLTHGAVNASIYSISQDIMVKIEYNAVSIIYVVMLLLTVLLLISLNGVTLKRKNTKSDNELSL